MKLFTRLVGFIAAIFQNQPKAVVLDLPYSQKFKFLSCKINIIDKSAEFPETLSQYYDSGLAKEIQKIFSCTKCKSVLHATLPSKIEDENALKEYINKALVEFCWEKPSIFLALKCEGKNLIHILAALPNDEKWKKEEELEKWPVIIEKLDKENYNGDSGTPNNGDDGYEKQQQESFKRRRLIIASVLFVLTLLGLFSYFVFVLLPDTPPNVQSGTNDSPKPRDLTKWQVVFTDNPKLPFEASTEVHFFESEQDCQNHSNSPDWRHYKSSVEPLTIKGKEPRWAKIRSGEEDLSDCTKGKEHTQDHRLQFSFKSNKFEGKRKIVIIAPSVQLAHGGIGRMIQNTLTEWLLELKNSLTSVPITVLLIGADKKIHTLISGEDLNELPDEGENSITAKINGIAFASDSFRSVYELEQIDIALEGEDFDQVLYLTDGNSYSGSNTLSTSLKMALGIPRDWVHDGISLSVLTVGDCGFWKKEFNEVVQCFTLDNQAKSQFKERLNELLHIN
jgi:hypothetical protein